jgi:DNA repair protein RecO (recombination protein O)
MFFKFRILGFVFKKEDRGEADQLFKIFSRDLGKIEVLGKGIRKISSKLRSQIDIFYLSEIEFVQGKTQKRLTDVLSIEKFKNLRKSIKKLSVAFRISEVLNELITGEEKDERIWNLILNTFQNLESFPSYSKIYNLIYYYFFWNLISILGHRPEIDHCCVCQKGLKSGKIYFNPNQGGTICQRCFENIKEGKEIDLNLIKILKIIMEKKFSFLKRLEFKEEDLKKLKTISDYYFDFLSKK